MYKYYRLLRLPMTSDGQNEILRIKEILKKTPRGMSVTEIARALNKNSHTVGRYLDILHISGHLEMRSYGKAKVFSLASRVPLDTVLGFSHDLVIVLDKDLRVVRINDEFLRMIQANRGDVVGRNISFLPFADHCAEALLVQITDSLKKQASDQEIKLGSETDCRFFHQKNIPTVFEDGGQGTTVILENITAQKSAELALRASEEQFRLMAENIRDGILIKENRKVVYANQRIEEIFGYSREELAAMPPANIAAPEDRDRMEKTIGDFMGSGNVPSDITFWIVRRDGSRRFIYSRVTSIEHGNASIRYIVITDMTEWKNAQLALLDQLGFLQHLVNTFPNPLYYVDTENRFLGCNSSFSAIIGKTRGEITGIKGWDRIDKTIAGFFRRHDEELIKKSGLVTYDGIVTYRDGSVHAVAVQKSTFTLTDGALAGVIGLVLSDRLVEED
jgi:PAS domain S-box-containing protein